MQIKNGYPNLSVVIFIVLTSWIINELEKYE